MESYVPNYIKDFVLKFISKYKSGRDDNVVMD